MRILVFILLFPAWAQAQLSQIDMTEREVRDFLGGNTIGSNDFGSEDDSLEYHGTDGRAIWYYQNKLEIGYYRVKGNRVCYTYEGEDLDDWFCWTFKKDRRTGEVWQWTDDEHGYRMFIVGEGDLASPQVETSEAEDAVEQAVDAVIDAIE